MPNKYCNLVGTTLVKDMYPKINTGFDNVEADISDLNAKDTELDNQLTQILNETALDPNKDPEVTNARTNTPLEETFATVKENVDAVTEKALTPKQTGGGLLINGNFDIWQRGTTSEGSGYTADRWTITASLSPAVSRESTDGTEPFNAKYKYRLVGTADGNININQYIENPNNILKDKQCTLSFWVKGDTAGTAKALLRNRTKAVSIQAITYNVTTDWVKQELTFIASSNWDVDDIIHIYPGQAFSANLNVEYAQIKLEIGAKATPFINKSYAEELRDCERYYYNTLTDAIQTGSKFGVAQVTGSTSARYVFELPEPMRIVPSFTYGGNLRLIDASAESYKTVTNISVLVSSSKRFGLTLTVDSGLVAGNSSIFGKVDLDAYLEFDAEL